MYLLDTVVLSETAKPRPSPRVVAWLARQDEATTFLSVLTLGEVARGIAAIRDREPVFARRLTAWLASTLRHYDGRILAVDVASAVRWGELAAALGHSGVDLLVAATALEHDLTVVTRNTRHFAGTGVRILNPFEAG
jgi:hypothetical protein